jgi:hemerythrin superfamily protein
MSLRLTVLKGEFMPADVVELIKADHREVERLFDLLKNQIDTRALYVPVLAALLIAHSRAEESEVYPVARSEAAETEEVAHSQAEHAEAEELLVQLCDAPVDSPNFDLFLQQLVDAVSHHVEEEEQKVLPGMQQRLSAERRAELADAFATARMEHLGDRPGQAKKEDLIQQADNIGISGASSKSKKEITEALLQEAEQSSE